MNYIVVLKGELTIIYFKKYVEAYSSTLSPLDPYVSIPVEQIFLLSLGSMLVFFYIMAFRF